MNKPVIITGCQRSGTTLLHLILDSHPDIHGVDEDAYDDALFAAYREEARFHPVVSFKLPRVAFNLQVIQSYPGVQVLWCVRDPRDVVVSMIDLHMRLSKSVSVSWTAHPHGGEYEIYHGFRALPKRVQRALAAPMRKYGWIKRKKRWARRHEDLVLTGALVWRIKHELKACYEAANIPHRVVRYEDLIGQSREEVSRILSYLQVPWHDNVLQHHRLHTGVSIGETDNTRPIDRKSKGRWKEELSEKEQEVVRDLCAEAAASYGYMI